MTEAHVKPTTTDAGVPVESDEHSLTVGPDGPILLQDHYLIEQMANFNRERIPERQPHAKGGGAFGRFEVTSDVSAYTKAAVFQPGTRTDTLIRFSTVAGERGSPDTWRDPRGFALKFYTSEGNYDMVGNNTPVFFIRDPLKFQHFIRSQKRRADNNLRDHDMQWDFWTLSPESAHQVTWLMGDRGIPKSWRHMNGYSSHTYMWINAAGEKFWVKYHFKTDQGVEYLTQAEADQLAGHDADYHQRDLYEAIERGEHPSWTLKMQVMPFEEARNYRFNPFDLTKVWPHGDYPLIEVGRLTLDRNPTDYHTEIEQAAFEPNNLVPGIDAEPGQDAAGPRVLLRRRAPRPARRELQADPGERAAGRRCTATARTARCASSTSPTRCTRRTPRAARRPTASTTSRSAGTPTATWCAPPTPCTRRTTTGARRARMVREVHRRRRPRPAGRQHRRPPARRRDRAGAAARLRVLAQRGQGPRRPGRGGRPRQAGLILRPAHRRSAEPGTRQGAGLCRPRGPAGPARTHPRPLGVPVSGHRTKGRQGRQAGVRSDGQVSLAGRTPPARPAPRIRPPARSRPDRVGANHPEPSARIGGHAVIDAF